MYIPDLTERYPEGFHCYYDDEPSFGYEPSYEELVITDPDYAEELVQWMENDPVGTQELINKYKKGKIIVDNQAITAINLNEN